MSVCPNLRSISELGAGFYEFLVTGKLLLFPLSNKPSVRQQEELLGGVPVGREEEEEGGGGSRVVAADPKLLGLGFLYEIEQCQEGAASFFFCTLHAKLSDLTIRSLKFHNITP